MLLVDDDQPKVHQRREHGRARADHDAHLAAGDGGVGQQPLPRRQPGVQHGDARTAEAPLDASHRLPRQADLGHEQQDRAAGLEGGLRGLQVDLGLAAPRHPVQQDFVAGLGLAQDAVQGALLFAEQVGDVRRAWRRPEGAPPARRRARPPRAAAPRQRVLPGAVRAAVTPPVADGVDDHDGPRLEQPPETLRRQSAGGAQLALLERAGLLQQVEGGPLAGRPGAPAFRRRAAAAARAA